MLQSRKRSKTMSMPTTQTTLQERKERGGPHMRILLTTWREPRTPPTRQRTRKHARNYKIMQTRFVSLECSLHLEVNPRLLVEELQRQRQHLLEEDKQPMEGSRLHIANLSSSGDAVVELFHLSHHGVALMDSTMRILASCDSVHAIHQISSKD